MIVKANGADARIVDPKWKTITILKMSAKNVIDVLSMGQQQVGKRPGQDREVYPFMAGAEAAAQRISDSAAQHHP